MIRILMMVVVLAAAFGAGRLHGGDVVFYVASGDWGNPTSWNPVKVPGGTDRAVINAGAIVNLSSNAVVGRLQFNGGIIQGPGSLTVSNEFEWNGGDLQMGAGGCALYGVTTLATSNTKYIHRRSVINHGIVNWIQGDLNITGVDTNAGGFVNAAGATFNILATNNTINDYYGEFRNLGTVVKSMPSTATVRNFVSAGLVHITEGTLRLNSGSTWSGSVVLANNATLLVETDNTHGHYYFNSLPVTGAGTLQLTSGNLHPAGTGLILDPGITLNMSGGRIKGSAPMTVNGPFLWSGGDLGDNTNGFVFNGGMTLQGLGGKYISRVHVTNNAVATWTAGDITINGADPVVCRFVNAPGATFHILATNNTLNDYWAEFRNLGTVVKSTPGMVTLRNFVTTGLVRIENGALRLNTGATWSGSVVLTNNATLLVETDNTYGHYYFNSLPVTGAGTLQLTSGNLHPAGTGLILDPGITLNMSGGRISGTAPMAVNGPFVWSGGTLFNNTNGFVFNGGMTLQGLGGKYIDRVNITNNAVATWTAGDITINGADPVVCRFVNAPGATFNILSTNNTMTDYWGEFRNLGTVVKSTPGMVTLRNFVTTGLVRIENGALRLNSGSTWSGGVVLTNNATLLVETDNTHGHYYFNSLPVTGAGTLQLTSGNLHPAGTGLILDPGITLNMSGGRIKGSAPLTVNGPFLWSGGTLGDNTNAFVFNGGMTLQGVGGKYIERLNVTNTGVANWTGGELALNGADPVAARLINAPGATFNIQADTTLNDYWGEFRNLGTVVKTSPGTAVVHSFNSTGSILVQSGTLRCARFATWSGALILTNNAKVRIEAGATDVITFNSLPVTGPGAVQVINGHLSLAGSGATLEPGTTLEQTGGRIKGPAPMTVNGPFLWSGGTLGDNTNAFVFNGGMTIGGGVAKYIERMTVTNNGVANWTDGDLTFNGADPVTARFVNAPGATFNIQVDRTQNDSWAEFRNLGTVVKTSPGTTVVNSFNSTGSILVQSGTLRCARFATWSGALILTNNAKVRIEAGSTDVITFNSLPITGPGAVQVIAGHLSLAGSGATLAPVTTLEQSGGRIKGPAPMTVNGPFLWSGGTLGDNTNAFVFNGGMTLSGISKYIERMTVTNNGVANWTAGDLTLNGADPVAGRLINAPGATFNIQADTTLSDSWGEFRNLGTVVKTSPGTAVVNSFNSTGSILVQTGTLRCARYATWSGALILTNNARVRIEAGSTDVITFNSLPITGPGAVQVVNGHLSIAGSGATLEPVTTLEQTGGRIKGPAPMTVNGPFLWSGGTLGDNTNAFVFNGGMTLSGISKYIERMTVTNNGVANWTAGDLTLNGADPVAGRFVNGPGATFNIQADTTLSDSWGEFRNLGTVVKTSPGTAVVHSFNSTGSILVQSGTLRCARFATWSGALILTNNARVRIEAGSTDVITFNSLPITGPGAVQVVNGHLSIAGSGATLAPVTTLEQSGGRIKGSAPMTVNGPFLWSGGTLGDNIAPFVFNGGMTLSGISKYIERMTVTNNAAAIWTAGVLDLNGVSGTPGRFVNGPTGDFQVQTDNTLQGSTGEIWNLGRFRKTAGTGTTVIDGMGFNNAGTLEAVTGTLEFRWGCSQTAGATLLAGGRMKATGLFLFQAGQLAGSGILDGNVALGGTLAPGSSPGAITINGNLTLSNQASLAFELGGAQSGAGHDYVDVNGSLAVAGNLNLTFLNGFETSVGTNALTVITANSAVSGAFANAASGGRLATADGLGGFEVQYGAGSPFGASNVVLASFLTPSNPPPVLTLRLLGPQVEVGWSTADSAFALETKGGLGAPHWVRVPEPPVVAGEQRTVTLGRTPTNAFFRLAR